MDAGQRCVLIDDDFDVLLIVVQLLQQALPRWEVISFQNSLAALVYLLNHRVDFVVTDFRMPEMDGLQLTGHLRSADIDIPVLVISGNDIEAQAFEMGASAFLSKAEFPVKLVLILDSLGLRGTASSGQPQRVVISMNTRCG
jgi:CheY-like chemotaxis protein